MVPPQKPGRSKQDYRTPPEFVSALERHLGIDHFRWDLAASAENCIGGVCGFDSEQEDALSRSWRFGYGGQVCWAYCNPPFAHLEPWAYKAWNESLLGAYTAMLVPAGIGSNWWRNWVDGKAYVLILNGRLTFVGETTPYPKDLCVLLYAPFLRGGYAVWNWRASDSPRTSKGRSNMTDSLKGLDRSLTEEPYDPYSEVPPEQDQEPDNPISEDLLKEAEWKDSVLQSLVTAIDDFLHFASVAELLKIVVSRLPERRRRWD